MRGRDATDKERVMRGTSEHRKKRKDGKEKREKK